MIIESRRSVIERRAKADYRNLDELVKHSLEKAMVDREQDMLSMIERR